MTDVCFFAVYIEIEDLLHRFSDPNVMDIKMGTRLGQLYDVACLMTSCLCYYEIHLKYVSFLR